MTEEFLVVDTSQVQTDSLIAYMGAVGYKYVNKGWVTDSGGMKHMSRIGHRNAIALHNLDASEWVLLANNMFVPMINGKLFDMAMNGYTLSRTQAAKLVKKVKMQPNRKAPEGIQLQYNMVKPFMPYMTTTLGLTV